MSAIKPGDKFTVAGIRYGKYPKGRAFTTRCRKGNETVLTVKRIDTGKTIKPAILS